MLSITFTENRRIKRRRARLLALAKASATSIYGITDPYDYLSKLGAALTDTRLTYELERARARCYRHVPHFVF